MYEKTAEIMFNPHTPTSEPEPGKSQKSKKSIFFQDFEQQVCIPPYTNMFV